MRIDEFKNWLAAPQKHPLIMGILNVTPDSFSDGGRFDSLDKAYHQAEQLIIAGADIIDIGGESSRPGAISISIDAELRRIIPVIEKIRKNYDVCISVDSCKPAVFSEAIQSGADIINDIFALRKTAALEVAAKLDVPVCLMHMQNTPQNMQQQPFYNNGVLSDIKDFFTSRLEACLNAGINAKNIILDPGFGFGKTAQHNLTILKNIKDFQIFNMPLLLGVSRKSTISKIVADVEQGSHSWGYCMDARNQYFKST